MTLSKWIEDYCEENDIELPEDIPDEETALMFLNTVANGGGSGGGASVEFVNLTSPSAGIVVSDKTYAEFLEMIEAGILVYLNWDLVDGGWAKGNTLVTSVQELGEIYEVDIVYQGSYMRFMCDSPDDYPLIID